MGGLGVRGPDCSLLCYLLSIDLKAGDSLPCMYTKENFITRFFDFYEKVNDLVTIFLYVTLFLTSNAYIIFCLFR